MKGIFKGKLIIMSFQSVARIWVLGAVLGLVLPAALSAREAIAAERIVLKYKIFEASIPVAELAELAETGEVSPTLDGYLTLAQQEPRRVRQALTHQIEVDALLLDRVLNSRMGEAILDQVGETIYPPSQTANQEAIRAALVMSAQDDDRINLIEVMQNYPTEEVYVDVDRLVATYEQINAFQRRLGEIMEQIDIF
jgi:hypothetical protein